MTKERTAAVTRDEVRVDRWCVIAAPASAFRWGRYGSYEPITPLWGKLLAKLRAEREAHLASEEHSYGYRGHCRLCGRLGPPPEVYLAKGWRSESRRECNVCGTEYLSFWRTRSGRCSDACWRAAKKAIKVPVTLRMLAAKKARRAAGRAGHKCAVCEAELTSLRSTRQYCSVKCRVAACRARKKAR